MRRSSILLLQGLIVASSAAARVEDLLAAYMPRFREDFFATLPAAQVATE